MIYNITTHNGNISSLFCYYIARILWLKFFLAPLHQRRMPHVHPFIFVSLQSVPLSIVIRLERERRKIKHAHTHKFRYIEPYVVVFVLFVWKKKVPISISWNCDGFFWKMWISIDDSIMKCLSSAHRTRIQRTRKWDRVIDFRFMSGTKWKWRQCNQSDATTENAKCLAFFYLFISIGNA